MAVYACAFRIYVVSHEQGRGVQGYETPRANAMAGV